eukprot:g31454.t1
MDGYFPYELKKDYPDGVMLKVIDRTADTYALWKEHASPFDRDLASDGDRLAVGQVRPSKPPAVTKEEEDASNVIEVMAWCKGVIQGLDWPQVLRLAKKECNLDAGDDELLRIGCTEAGLVAALDGSRAVMELAQLQRLVCPNGQIFLLAVTLAYAREQLSFGETSRAQAMLWHALQNNFMLDASVWPVKTHDVLHMFDHLPAPLSLAGLGGSDLHLSESVTLVVPRCPPRLVELLKDRLPGLRALIGIVDEAQVLRATAPSAMAVVAGQGPESVQITVRNTFLNVVEEDEDPLFRTSSDPLGGQCQIEARHIAKAKQLASSSRSLYSHDEATETEAFGEAVGGPL